ncbi:MAG: DUF2318 domain-containing protein [Planctomycetota bacterium]|jgi:uncharacterized membrane protein|nr:DUF2318 domain-containing protein [Planctomycetota bacterium]
MSKRIHRIPVALAFLFAAAIFPAAGGEAAVVDGDLVIARKDLSNIARFYPVVIEGYTMEIIAVTAPDRTIRVVFNACQACGPAGYRQSGDSVICKACGNAFKLSVLERRRGGCNPIPVGEKNRRDDGANIVVAREFLKRAKDYFSRL